jgi:hypothetical protein
MVLRKPTPQESLVPAPLSQAANNPPYPTTPATEQPPFLSSSPHYSDVFGQGHSSGPGLGTKGLDGAQKPTEDSESDYSEDDWERPDDEDSAPEDIPETLKVGGGKPIPPVSKNTLPDALRAGPPPGAMVRRPTDTVTADYTGASAASWGATSTSSKESIPLKTNNPYLRMQATGQSNWGGESSAQVWGEVPSAAQKREDIAELPAAQTPIAATAGFSQLSLNSNVPPQRSPYSPDQPPLIAVESATPQSSHPRQDSNASSAFDAGVDISSLDAFSRSHGLPSDSNPMDNPRQSWQEQQAWEQSERERKQRELAAAQKTALEAEQERKYQDEWHAGEQAGKYTPSSSPFEDYAPPTLPPRRSHEEEYPNPPQPPHPINTAAGVSTSRPEVESPNTTMKKQTKESYKIKHIRWYDSKKNGIRKSPILTQNANGPCPLLALVNALVLSTPADEETALIETLRTREQVSLGLLLDAVFDELMSGRRGGAAQELPDVGELYKFLLTLHTGMNVNPMFVQDPAATDGPSALIPSLMVRPGGFENTREMRLYKTFSIPLVHGWLPDNGSEAYVAFERVAKTYEDAQNAQFQEEELEGKLQDEGLSPDEQTLFTDLIAIKEFLTQWPTQLTTFGLETIQKSMEPAQIGILFRNDHFSTLYKHPRTGQLLTLVTDAGYSSHDEIVWESLVDVTGRGSEMYSGDFRPVGNNDSQRPQGQQPIQSLLDVDDNQGWHTVQSGRRRNNQGSDFVSQDLGSSSGGLSKEEQEDHDLALALQLQEEEEDRHRRSLEERRRRENQLSEDIIGSQVQGRPQNAPISQNPPLIPPRRSNLPVHRPNDDPLPPPTYEEAASGQPYHPPQGHAPPAGRPPGPNTPMRPNAAPQGSAYMANTGILPPRPNGSGRRPSRPVDMGQFTPGRLGRRQSAGVSSPGRVEERSDKCVVM